MIIEVLNDHTIAIFAPAQMGEYRYPLKPIAVIHESDVDRWRFMIDTGQQVFTSTPHEMGIEIEHFQK
jgi:hypothetical protein